MNKEIQDKLEKKIKNWKDDKHWYFLRFLK